MLRMITWTVIWLLLGLGAADIRISFTDGLTLNFKGWWGVVKKWINGD